MLLVGEPIKAVSLRNLDFIVILMVSSIGVQVDSSRGIQVLQELSVGRIRIGIGRIAIDVGGGIVVYLPPMVNPCISLMPMRRIRTIVP